MNSAWPLTGRAEELQFIGESLADPSVGGVVVSAAAGIGKSRLAREAVDALPTARHVIRWAVGTTSAATIPLGAFTSWAAEADDRMQLVRSVVDGLTAVDDPRRTAVIGVDDAHLLDELSVFVLHQIVHRRAAKLVLVVRSGEQPPPGLIDVARIGDLERLDLQPLSRDDTSRAVAAALGAELDPEAARRMWRLTGGNVLYLRNIVEHEVSQGRMTKVGGRWQWVGQPVVPPSLVDLIETRIGTLSSTVGDVVDILAVGEPVELASLRHVVDPAAIEEAEERGLIALDDIHGRVVARVAHPLYGEVRRSRAAVTRLRRLRGLVVDELARCDDRDELRVVMRRATLTLESDLPIDPALFTRAAEGAVYLSDLALADRFAEAAIAARADREAYFIRAHALSWLSRGGEADDVLCAIPQSDHDPDLAARIAFLRAINRLFALADPRSAADVVEDAATASGVAAPCVRAYRMVHAAAMGRPRDAATMGVDVEIGALPPLVGAVTAWGRTVAEGDLGRVRDAIAASMAGYALASTAYDAGQMRFVVADGHVGVLLQAGLLAEATATAAALCADAVDRPGAALLMATAISGRCALASGRLAAAVASLAPVVDALVAAGDTNGWAYRYQLPLTTALAMTGTPAEARAALRRLDELRHPGWVCVDHEHEIARAWVAAQEGAVSEAIRLLHDAACAARADGRNAPELTCLQLAAQFGDRSGADRLTELVDCLEGPRAAAVARFATSLRAGDGTDIASAAGDLAALGDLVAAADVASHAAQTHRRRGLRGSAYAASAQASAWATDCGSPTTPALLLVEQRVPLTAREREIVTLIGEGLSSRAVADRLTLSPRTIEGHIYRAMNKTGTTTREELAALLHRRPGDGRTRRAE